jgi:hypothetical protein
MELFKKLLSILDSQKNQKNYKVPNVELSEAEALSIIQSSECVFLKQASQYIHNAYVSDPKIGKRNILLADIKVKASRVIYQSCGKLFPYNEAIDVLFKGFRERELKRKDLETAFRQAVSDGDAKPLI